jgi:hypothetical protein
VDQHARDPGQASHPAEQARAGRGAEGRRPVGDEAVVGPEMGDLPGEAALERGDRGVVGPHEGLGGTAAADRDVRLLPGRPGARRGVDEAEVLGGEHPAVGLDEAQPLR